MIILAAGTIAAIIKAMAIVEFIGAVAVVILNFAEIIDWFEQRRTKVPAVDNAQIYFTLKELWATGNYNTVQGVFDTRTSQVRDTRRIRSRSVEPRIAAAHRYHRLVNYT
jgi:hypothetical protein